MTNVNWLLVMDESPLKVNGKIDRKALNSLTEKMSPHNHEKERNV